MIIDGIISFVTTVISYIVSLFPYADPEITEIMDVSTLQTLFDKLAFIDVIFPISTFLVLFSAAISIKLMIWTTNSIIRGAKMFSAGLIDFGTFNGRND